MDKIIDELIRKRPSGGCTAEELQAFAKVKRIKVKVDDMVEFSSEYRENLLMLYILQYVLSEFGTPAAYHVRAARLLQIFHSINLNGLRCPMFNGLI
ncbi:unnamed protein product [Phytophthora fragariaefolia]|uniref:Unnamed protein product n=1 Tax=Phytophthora fragariaefolia TaxID=1490495 RepID=A0A9W6XY98_9STRA|nr:unnamed protein product [Phytophthora fragariaefolia]